MRIIILVIIGLIPFNFIKVYLYRFFFHYTICKRCRIGFSLILCKKVILENDVRIGNFNLIYNTQSLVMKSGADLGSRNIIKNLTTMTMEQNSKIWNGNHLGREAMQGESGNFTLGKNSVITGKHLFDVTDDIRIGHDTVIAGNGTQFWTHGFDIYRNLIVAPIQIKDHCYLGSSCLVNLGVTVESDNQIAFGTVVSKSIVTRFGFWTSNQLVRKKDCLNISEEENYVHDTSFTRIPLYHKCSGTLSPDAMAKFSTCLS
jgi:acetyltransferase-like isoleucine patch superfamily enzyme